VSRFCTVCGDSIKYRTVCNKCTIRKSRRKTKQLVFSWYGKKCICCEETGIDFLTLDHIKDDAVNSYRIMSRRGKTISIRRRKRYTKMMQYKTNSTGQDLYSYIRMLGKNKIPKNLQILCFNCQWGKRLGKGFCMHHPRIDLRILNGR
jgi:hypothetical protein